MKENTNSFYVCNECHAVCCNMYYDEHFGTHIWCNDKKNGHYICFIKEHANENPYGTDKYQKKTWRCPEHQVENK